MNIEREGRQRASGYHPSGAADEDDGLVIPGSAPPLSPGRTDVNPDDQAGVDELPGNELEFPLDETSIKPGTPDIDVDKAETDDAPNPR